jgi:hypothetical protein
VDGARELWMHWKPQQVKLSGQQGPWASAGTAHISVKAATWRARAQRQDRVTMILSSVPVWWTIAACKLIQSAEGNRVGLLTWRHCV